MRPNSPRKPLRRRSLTPSIGLLALVLATATIAEAQPGPAAESPPADKFRQLEELLPTPNETRTASGAPARAYWQQRADYEISAELDDTRRTVRGREWITYHNHSPDRLGYLWLQLDANIFRPDADSVLGDPAPDLARFSHATLRAIVASAEFDGGVSILGVHAADGTPLEHTIVKTMMRVDLPTPLEPQSSIRFHVEWDYAINDCRTIWGRTGYEYFKEDGNTLYLMAQWFPRLASYTDVTGWQHKQFLGNGEFTLEFGDYLVSLTVPSDFIVGATGVLQNPEDTLTPTQQARLTQAETARTPVFIVTPEEAVAAQSTRTEDIKNGETKTWVFSAENVRDFAFACSRKFIWDAQRVSIGARHVWAMSYYPIEAEPLWSKYSTHSIIHTLEVYSRYTFEYPYPVAISVNGPIGGMEYPMICFNGPRPEKDGTYSKRTKYGLISVIIHEVGHNYFPMIVNSDERQWTWMDEGLNTFLQYLAEQEWEEKYPSWRGEPQKIVEYMRSTDQVPIMTNSESLLQFGNNAYAKPATALNILRETILGRELFDFAFKEYARRWMFKRPMPADFFRTMEDASGIDLDWFWRGWFYTTDRVDIAITGVEHYRLDAGDPEAARDLARLERDAAPLTLSVERNRDLEKRVEFFPELKDFYNQHDDFEVTEKQQKSYAEFLAPLEDEDRAIVASCADLHFYLLRFRNVGGLVMPILLDLEFADGAKESLRLPAEIWRRNSEEVARLLITERELKSIELDPRLETADTDRVNNYWPPRPQPTRFKLFKEEKLKNPMQEAAEPAVAPGKVERF
ncbi:MAG: M1 family metallopeptidase [Planctomycetota bacterium]